MRFWINIAVANTAPHQAMQNQYNLTVVCTERSNEARPKYTGNV